MDSFLFGLLRYSLGIVNDLPLIAEEEWEQCYTWAKEQALVGVIYKGIERMPKERRPQKRLLLKWYSQAEKVKGRNEKAYEACGVVAEMFRRADIECCVLKGQGNALMYDSYYERVAGDIDLWVNPDKVSIADGFFAVGKVRFKVGRQVYHHFDVQSVRGICLEIHTRPSFMNNLVHNRRMQKWFTENASRQYQNSVELPDGKGTVSVPLPEFNVVYQLAHISKHIFQDGIGLRQFVDYYYVLKSEMAGREQMAGLLRHLGLFKVAQAVMYVEHHVLGLEEKYFVVPESERYGSFLIQEIMISGNFGQYDKRIGTFYRKTALGRNLERFRRDLRMVSLFPSECLWEPVFRIWHFFWRVKNV